MPRRLSLPVHGSPLPGLAAGEPRRRVRVARSAAAASQSQLDAVFQTRSSRDARSEPAALHPTTTTVPASRQLDREIPPPVTTLPQPRTTRTPPTTVSRIHATAPFEHPPTGSLRHDASNQREHRHVDDARMQQPMNSLPSGRKDLLGLKIHRSRVLCGSHARVAARQGAFRRELGTTPHRGLRAARLDATPAAGPVSRCCARANDGAEAASMPTSHEGRGWPGCRRRTDSSRSTSISTSLAIED